MRKFLEVLNDAPDNAGGQEQPDHCDNDYRHRAEKEPGGFDHHLLGRGLHICSRPCDPLSAIHPNIGSTDLV